MSTCPPAPFQLIIECFEGRVDELRLPPPEEPLLEGISWGRFDEFFTPAFWKGQAWICHRKQRHQQYRLGRTLLEEAAACVLGGHGMPAEVGLAAFYHLQKEGFFASSTAACATETSLEAALTMPLACGGRRVRYRFPRQKARCLAPLLRALAADCPPTNGHENFRKWFLSFPGIGPKTASWITRNWLDSDSVAILDIHIHRAGVLCGIFRSRDQLSRDYFGMEERFLEFAQALGVRASLLDNLIWQQMRLCTATVLRMLQV